MSEVTQLTSNYKEIRQRLRFPPNAVADIGIDLRRKMIPESASKKEEPVVLVSSPANPDLTCKVTIKEMPLAPSPKIGVSLARVEWMVCQYFKITQVNLYTRRRTRDVVYPRQICWYLACQHTVLSLPTIGRRFGYDHSTILHARDKIAEMMLVDPGTVGVVKAIEAMIFPDNGPKNDQPEPSVATISQFDMAQEQEGSLSQSEICPMD